LTLLVLSQLAGFKVVMDMFSYEMV